MRFVRSLSSTVAIYSTQTPNTKHKQMAFHSGWAPIPTIFTSRHLLHLSLLQRTASPTPTQRALVGYLECFKRSFALVWQELSKGAVFEGEDWMGDLGGLWGDGEEFGDEGEGCVDVGEFGDMCLSSWTIRMPSRGGDALNLNVANNTTSSRPRTPTTTAPTARNQTGDFLPSHHRIEFDLIHPPPHSHSSRSSRTQYQEGHRLNLQKISPDSSRS